MNIKENCAPNMSSAAREKNSRKCVENYEKVAAETKLL